jgi:glycosyltransferase involved in cell wall biosynthesis
VGAAGPGGPLIALSANDGWAVVNYRRGLIAALQGAGFRAAVLAPDGPYSDAIRGLGASFHALPMQAKGRSPLGDLIVLGRYRRALRRLRPDAFLGFTIKPNIYGSLAAHSLGIPVINNITGLGAMFERQGALNLLVTALYRVALDRSARVFFQNRDDRALFVERKLVRPARAGSLPGSGVDLDHFRPVSAPERTGTTFLLASRLLWAKGIGEYAEAARILRQRRSDVRFRLAGPLDPPGTAAVARSDLQRWAEEGLIDYRGSVTDIREELAEADCAVLPSFYREGVPRILLEASAMALPVITADSIGCRDAVVDGETGFLCEPKNAPSLAAAMERVADMPPDERRAMGLAGRARVERGFSEALVHRLYLEALVEAGVEAP